MADAKQETERRGREGGRWINERPTSEEFAQWFTDTMRIDPLLNVVDYMGGVVLIPALDKKAKTVVGFKDGKPLVEEREELSFVPYAKVETRIQYFWDYIGAHDELLGIVTPVDLPRMPVDPREDVIDAIASTEEKPEQWAEIAKQLLGLARPSALATMVHQLPPGFSILSVPVADGYSHFICSTMHVAIYRREDYEKGGAVPIRQGRGTKQVPMIGQYNNRVWAEQSSLMKAETGALGRALGFAGIFVIPGSGIATAEDMIEATTQGDAGVSSAQEPGGGPAAPQEPAAARTGAETAVDEETALRTKAAAIYKELSEDYPEAATAFGQWAHQRKLKSLSEAKGAMLVGVVKKLEKLKDEAEARTQQAAETKPVDEEGPVAEEATDGEPSGPSS